MQHKPENIENLNVTDMKNLFPNTKRKYPLSIEILKYWENDFNLDFGEPECFACKKYFQEGAEKIENSNNFQIWNKYLYKCHIVSKCFGGPEEVWNIVYLCDWCHKCFDNTFSGQPFDYYNGINWIKNRNEFLIKRLYYNCRKHPAIQYVNLKNINICLELLNSQQSSDYANYNKTSPSCNLFEQRNLKLEYTLDKLQMIFN